MKWFRHSVGDEIRRLRDRLGPVPRPDGGRMLRLHLRHEPDWLEAGHPLLAAYDDCGFLVRNGQAVWAFVVQAGSRLYFGSREPIAARVVYSLDPYFDDRVRSLCRLALELLAVKGSARAEVAGDPAVSALLDGEATPQNLPVPRLLVENHEMFLTSLVIHMKELPARRLVFSWIPILVAPEATPAATMVSGKLWTRRYRRFWRRFSKDGLG